MRSAFLLLLCCLHAGINIIAQTGGIHGKILDLYGKPVPNAYLVMEGSDTVGYTDNNGHYVIDSFKTGEYELVIKADGFDLYQQKIAILLPKQHKDFVLVKTATSLEEIVISGTMKAVSKLESPVPVEVYAASYFKANPTPSIFDALQNINGVRPQLNCNVCNTGDIHINGLEGPYTMVLIDGMPIVSGLSTVYGLSGIPQSLIERVEVVKGPASTLYGSEAVGGLINIITKQPAKAPKVAIDIFGTSWQELNADLAAKFKLNKNIQSLAGLHYFNYQHPVDKNQDGFTDLTLQHRISIFNKWHIIRKEQRVFDVAARYVFENRWGGEMNWQPKYRGTDEVYGEQINTKRWELLGTYQLPLKEKILFQFSANNHHQDAMYGTMPFIAQQSIVFGQLTWFKTIKKHDLLTGLTFRHTYYDDNTAATVNHLQPLLTQPNKTNLPGVFIQDAIQLHPQHVLLLGLRYDYHSLHGNIFTPRINYKWQSYNKKNIIRMSVGNGYRVANVFTEDHAALTGARKVEFIENLKPETSWNGNINFVKKVNTTKAHINMDASLFYTHFMNKIIADYHTDPNKIRYGNLDGYAVSKGLSLNLDVTLHNGLKAMMGLTFMDVYSVSNSIKTKQLFTEQFSATWNIGYTIRKLKLTIDYTGNVYSPMHLPLLSETDPRSSKSPWWSIQNIQFTRSLGNKCELYLGIKNLLNWTPNKSNPFIIARSHDPFDKNVVFDNNGKALVTPDNPYGLTFDPTYVYGPNQGRRLFLGLRVLLN